MNEEKRRKQDAIKYGDVFDVSGELAAKPIAPQDAATVESAENLVLGETPMGGVAAVMKSAGEVNERRGIVRHDDTTDIVRDKGAVISETTIVGHRIISLKINSIMTLTRDHSCPPAILYLFDRNAVGSYLPGFYELLPTTRSQPMVPTADFFSNTQHNI